MQHEFKENTEDTCVKKVFASNYSIVPITLKFGLYTENGYVR